MFIFIICVLFINGCETDKENQDNQPPAEIRQKISQFSLTQTKNGKIRWILNSNLATFLESNEINLGEAKLIIFGNKEEDTLNITGSHGEVNQRTKDIKLWGNVVGVLSDGTQFYTQEVYWSESRGKIYTLPNTKVKMIYKDSIVNGEELSIDPEMETADLKNVQGISRGEERINE